MFKRRPNLFALRGLPLAACLLLFAGCGGGGGDNAASAAAPVAPATAPLAPINLVANSGDAQASLTWSASSNATSYHVKRATINGGPYTQVGAPTAAAYTDSSVTNGTTYYYVVSALNAVGESANSTQVSALPAVALAVPAAPTGLSATPSNGQVTLNWSASSGATSYHVMRATSSNGAFTPIATLASTSYADISVINGTTYYYVVSALNAAGEGANSIQVSAMPTAGANSGSTIVQAAVKDSAPNYVDSYDTGSGIGNAYAAQSAEFATNTHSGSMLLAFSVIAYDGQYTITNVSDPVNGNWTLVGTLLHSAVPGNSHIGVYAKFNAAPLLTTSWSGTGSVSSGGVLTLGPGTGTFRIGQRILSASTPVPRNTQNVGSLPKVDNIVTVVAKLSGTLGAPGSTYQLNPNINAVTFASEPMTTRDFVSVLRNTPSPPQVPGDYAGTYVLELSGTSSTAYFSGHNDTPGSAGTDTVTSGVISSPSVPGLLVGFSFNGGLNYAPEPAPYPLDQYYPNRGTGFTNSVNILAYNVGSPIVTAEWKHVANINGQAATFSPPKASDYTTVAVAIPDGP